jgi:AraC-like DNA-binding protein
MPSHDFYELYFFMQGSAGYIVENGHYALQKGDILLISPSNLHQLDISDTSAAYERVVLWLSRRYLDSLSSDKTDLSECFRLCSEHKNHLIRDPVVSSAVKTLLLDLYALDSSDEFGKDLAAEIKIKSLALTLCRYVLSESFKSFDALRKSNDKITRLIDYINAHLDSPLSLDTLAEAMFVSKYHLSRLFKTETGITLHRYIVKKRLILSKRFIEENLPVNEIYQKCGFCDYTHFFRAFKQEYGITPKQYYATFVPPPSRAQSDG